MKKEVHNTENGYCCACEYDIAIMEGKIRKVKKEIEDFCYINSHKAKEGKFVWLKDLLSILRKGHGKN